MPTSFTTAKTLLAAYVDNGLDPDNARVAARINEAQRRLIDHYNFLSRREELEKELLTFTEGGVGGNLILDNLDATKVMILALWREENNELEMATALEQKALAFVERNLMAEVQRARRVVTGEVGRLHNELATGLKVPTSRMTALLNQAVSDAIAHQKFLQKPDDDDFAAPPVSFEIKRTLVESYLASLEGATEVALGLKKTAIDLIQRDVVASDETYRRTIRMELSLGSPNSFGYYWGRIGLGFDGALTFSNNAIKRAVTSAEEALMNSGKWVGTVADYSFTLEQSGEVFLPREVETVLFVTFDGDPRPVHDRFAEYMRGGTGIKTTEEPWRSGFSDRGEAVDPDDGITKRRYFVSVPQENKETLVRYLAKRRFVPHLEDTDSMYLNNYEAVAQAAMAILTQGKAGSFDAGKKLLADQMTQQYFKSQVFGVHNRSILAMR